MNLSIRNLICNNFIHCQKISFKENSIEFYSTPHVVERDQYPFSFEFLKCSYLLNFWPFHFHIIILFALFFTILQTQLFILIAFLCKSFLILDMCCHRLFWLRELHQEPILSCKLEKYASFSEVLFWTRWCGLFEKFLPNSF